MKEMMNELVEAQLEELIDKHVSKKMMQDEMYLKDIEDAKIIENRLEEMNLTVEQKRLIDDYIACMSSAYIRMRDIAYLSGMEHAMLLMENTNN